MRLDKQLHHRKPEVLAYYRSRAEESLAEITRSVGSHDFRRRASAINKEIQVTCDRLIASLRQEAEAENWPRDEALSNILMLSYCSSVVMIEFRNAVWPYEYMAFSRRIGERWERFCALCFEHPARDDVRLFVPPLFSEVRNRLTQEIRDYVGALPLTEEQRSELLRYYDKVWGLVTSGEIKLELDVHTQVEDVKYVIDLKSGFGSNEKGNTNRLLLVASIYKNLEEENYRCLMLVRQKEDENNHYLLTLKNSRLWEVHCGEDAYEAMRGLSGFDIAQWVHNYIDWHDDLSPETLHYLQSQDLTHYLKW